MYDLMPVANGEESRGKVHTPTHPYPPQIVYYMCLRKNLGYVYARVFRTYTTAPFLTTQEKCQLPRVASSINMNLLGMCVVRTFRLEKTLLIPAPQGYLVGGRSGSTVTALSQRLCTAQVSFLNPPHASGEAPLHTDHTCQPQLA